MPRNHLLGLYPSSAQCRWPSFKKMMSQKYHGIYFFNNIKHVITYLQHMNHLRLQQQLRRRRLQQQLRRQDDDEEDNNKNKKNEKNEKNKKVQIKEKKSDPSKFLSFLRS